jgi:hypothetical protein
MAAATARRAPTVRQVPDNVAATDEDPFAEGRRLAGVVEQAQAMLAQMKDTVQRKAADDRDQSAAEEHARADSVNIALQPEVAGQIEEDAADVGPRNGDAPPPAATTTTAVKMAGAALESVATDGGGGDGDGNPPGDTAGALDPTTATSADADAAVTAAVAAAKDTAIAMNDIFAAASRGDAAAAVAAGVMALRACAAGVKAAAAGGGDPVAAVTAVVMAGVAVARVAGAATAGSSNRCRIIHHRSVGNAADPVSAVPTNVNDEACS